MAYEHGYLDGKYEAQPHWVSVEDELPKEEKLYMTVHRNSKTVRLNWWRNPWGFCYEGSTVEYWMPLPEPPQEDA